jgi:hypothetical protein
VHVLLAEMFFWFQKKGGDGKYMRESEILKYVFLCLGCCDMAMDLPWAD